MLWSWQKGVPETIFLITIRECIIGGNLLELAIAIAMHYSKMHETEQGEADFCLPK